MDKPVKFPDLPELGPDVPPAVRDWCLQVNAILHIALGRQAKNTNSRMVTIHDLVKAGVVADGVIN